MYSAYKLNKQGDSIQPWRTPFPIWNQSVVQCPVLTGGGRHGESRGASDGRNGESRKESCNRESKMDPKVDSPKVDKMDSKTDKTPDGFAVPEPPKRKKSRWDS